MRKKYIKEMNKKISALDPRFRKKIEDLFEAMNESISILYNAAIHDEKTGIYNNKFFNNILEMELEKAKRGQEKLSLIMMDIDLFKKINDTYGHVKADEILKKLALLVQKQIRKSDVFARFGGEEFVLLLPETPITKAKKFAKRIKTKIHEDKFLKKHSVTVSGGITEFKKSDNKKSFLSRVDKALYKAKMSGRDKFVVEL